MRDNNDIFEHDYQTIERCIKKLETMHHMLALWQYRFEEERHTLTEKDYAVFSGNLLTIQKSCTKATSRIKEMRIE